MERSNTDQGTTRCRHILIVFVTENLTFHTTKVESRNLSTNGTETKGDDSILILNQKT
jgi:hypothetical protein